MISLNLTHVSNTTLQLLTDSNLLIQLAVLRNCDSKNNKKYVDVFLKELVRHILTDLLTQMKLPYQIKFKVNEVLKNSNTRDTAFLMERLQVSITTDQIIKDNTYFLTECKKLNITVL